MEGNSALPAHPWNETNLGSVAAVEVGGTPSTAIPAFWGGEIPWMSSGDIHQRRITDVPGRITTLGLQSSNAKIIPPPTVAMALAGQGKTRGAVALTLLPLCTNQSVALIKPHEEVLDTTYLFHELDNRYEELRARSAGGGRAGLSKSLIEAVPIPVPPLPEQRRIAEILDTVDATIQQTEALIAKLKQMKAGLLHDLLTRGLDAHGHLRDPVAHPEQFKDSPLGRISREWEVQALGAIAGVGRGKFAQRPRNDPRFYGGPYPFIQTGDVTSADGGVIEACTQTLNERGKAVSREFPANTIAVTIAANIADTAILGRPMFFPDSIVGVEVHAPHSVRYIELCIRRAKPRLNARAPQSAQKNINLEDLRPLLIAVATPQEQCRIVEVCETYDKRVRAEGAELDKLKQLKKGLMADLLTGRVWVRPGEIAAP